MDVNRIFAAAEASFRQGRYSECRDALTRLEASVGLQSGILHLRGLAEKRLGALDAARATLGAAHARDPTNAEIANNLASVLVELGAFEEALTYFDRAIALAPQWAEARLNRAIALQRLGRFAAAREAFESLRAGTAGIARYWSAWGMLEREAGDLDAAAEKFDRALAIKPDHPRALKGRARVALERGEADAVARHERARFVAPGDPELLIGEAEAREAAGDPAGIALLAEAVRARPDWVQGQETLARMRWEAGHEDRSMEEYASALAAQPDNRSLHFSSWRTLIHAERHGEALAALDQARGALGEDDELLLMEGLLASECGELARSEATLSRLPQSDTVVVARARNALRAGDPARAEGLLYPLTAKDPDNIAAWAHLALAWRSTGDPRYAWLCGQPGLIGTHSLDLTEAELEAVGAALRDLHRTWAHPIGQSLRGGTQTRGRLFLRLEPEVRMLRDAIVRAVARHVDRLPPADPGHPLLRYRNARIAPEGSWSVRLTDGGFHVSHIHPQGILSSACYLSLPPSMGHDGSQDGWLELGRPPADLGLDLEPIATIEPRPGRLALFPSYVFHGTRPFAVGERLTAAFDLAAS